MKLGLKMRWRIPTDHKGHYYNLGVLKGSHKDEASNIRNLSGRAASILTLCSKARIVLIIAEVLFCFIAMTKRLVSASVLPSWSCYENPTTSQHMVNNKF